MVGDKYSSQKYDKLSQKIVSQYWEDFRTGRTWNYFISSQKYLKSDTWATESKWVEIAEECFEKKINLLQALEILLITDFDNYFPVADEIVSSWFHDDRHDDYYYFDILALFPKEHEIRNAVFNSEFIESLVLEDDWGQSSLARSALIRSNDLMFQEYLGDWLNRAIESERGAEFLEINVLPLLVEFGNRSKSYISQRNIDKLKCFVVSYLEKDKNFVEFSLNDGDVYSYGRTIWVADNIGYWSWALDWQDIIYMLKNSEWYWIALFSEFWGDEDNNNLVTWAMLHDDDIIRSRAVEVMGDSNAISLDGAIAWRRIVNFQEQLTGTLPKKNGNTK